MKEHFSEADLLETYYTQPGESMPVMMHLAECSACAARYERLERKMRSLAPCDTEKPDSFWARQRMLVMRRIETDRHRTWPRTARLAAAAVMLFVLGGVAVMNIDRVAAPPQARVVDSAPAPAPEPSALEDSVSADPWQSEELEDFQSMVAWESWVEPNSTTGDQS